MRLKMRDDEGRGKVKGEVGGTHKPWICKEHEEVMMPKGAHRTVPIALTHLPLNPYFCPFFTVHHRSSFIRSPWARSVVQ